MKKQRGFLLKMLAQTFLEKRKSQDYEEMVGVLMQSFQALGARMSIKMHFLHSHLDDFPKNCGDYSEEQDKRFCQDIAAWKNDTKVAGMSTCCPTTVGVLSACPTTLTKSSQTPVHRCLICLSYCCVY